MFWQFSIHICHYVWKVVRTSSHCIVVIKSQGKGPIKYENNGTNVLLRFRIFSPQLKIIDIIKCSSDNFPYMVTYIVMYGKLSEHHFNGSLFLNCGEKVLKRIKISCIQDLRVWLYYSAVKETWIVTTLQLGEIWWYIVGFFLKMKRRKKILILFRQFKEEPLWLEVSNPLQ